MHASILLTDSTDDSTLVVKFRFVISQELVTSVKAMATFSLTRSKFSTQVLMKVCCIVVDGYDTM